MSYVQGFVVPVPSASQEAYRAHAARYVPLFQEFGAARVVHAWGDDVPDGKLTDLKGAVQARPDETVVVSWHEYSSQDAAMAAYGRMMSDPRMKTLMEAGAPFDGKRLIYGGFASLRDDARAGAAPYVDVAIIPVPTVSKDEFAARSATMAEVLKEHGATRVVDGWGANVPDGQVTDFRRAVKATPEETIVYSWIEWPSRQVRDAGWQKFMADPRVQGQMPFDGKRMIFGGFASILDA
ncbi:DUF1428 domain-containing protein [Roseococcus sp.]|uniref:DUF1428 domain-containing protein n=1 Tax=Roseococcus sp. TaxID=2109646 RepID=UPI003BAB0547